MNIKLIVAVMLSLVLITVAQTASNYSVQSSQGPLTGCQTPVVGTNTLCSGPDGWYIASGSTAYVKLGPGVAGPIGLTGPVGPAGTLPATFTCTLTIPVAGSPATLSGCH